MPSCALTTPDISPRPAAQREWSGGEKLVVNFLPNGREADIIDLRFLNFAHAAFTRTRSAEILAAQQLSPNLPFERVKTGGKQPCLPPRPARTGSEQMNPPYALKAIAHHEYQTDLVVELIRSHHDEIKEQASATSGGFCFSCRKLINRRPHSFFCLRAHMITIVQYLIDSGQS